MCLHGGVGSATCRGSPRRIGEDCMPTGPWRWFAKRLRKVIATSKRFKKTRASTLYVLALTLFHYWEAPSRRYPLRCLEAADCWDANIAMERCVCAVDQL